jgi:hypothetical protein
LVKLSKADRIREHGGPPLPISYKVIIVTSVVMIFALGLVFFSLRNQKITTSFQIYGPALVSGQEQIGFKAVQFDNEMRKNLPVKVSRCVVATSKDRRILEMGTSGPSSLPWSFSCITPAVVKPETALATVTVIGWDGQSRDVTFPLDIVPRSHAQATTIPRVLPIFSWPEQSAGLQMDLAFEGNGLVENVPNNVWLRIVRDDNNALQDSLVVQYSLDEGPLQDAPAFHDLGLALLVVTPEPTTQLLNIEVTHGGQTVVWQERIVADLLAKIDYPEDVLGTEHKVPTECHDEGEHGCFVSRVGQTIFRSALDGTNLHCVNWRAGSPALYFEIATKDRESAEVLFDLWQAGIQWLTCSDTYLGSDDFVAYAPVLVSNDGEAGLATLTGLLQDQAIDRWPLASLDPDQRRAALGYLLARLAPEGLAIKQVYNTYQDDVESLAEGAGEQRDLVLILIGLVGFGLILWTVAVAVKQHRSLNRSFRDFLEEEEDSEAELTQEGLARKRSYLPAVMILVTAAANLAALIWLLRLVFF